MRPTDIKEAEGSYLRPAGIKEPYITPEMRPTDTRAPLTYKRERCIFLFVNEPDTPPKSDLLTLVQPSDIKKSAVFFLFVNEPDTPPKSDLLTLVRRPSEPAARSEHACGQAL